MALGLPSVDKLSKTLTNPIDFIDGSLGALLFDKELRLGVTGLSRAGKSTFITSLVNLIKHLGDPRIHPLLTQVRAYQDGRLKFGNVVSNQDLFVQSFPYEESLDAILGSPSRWPQSTQGISKIKLELHYLDKNFLGWESSKKFYLEIFDYPGEWLIDTILIALNYEEFSKKVLEHLVSIGAKQSAQSWIDEINKLDPDASYDDYQIRQISLSYKKWLWERKEQGLDFIVPGRFILPGEYKDTPILEFFPWLGRAPQARQDNSLYAELRRRYENYRVQIAQKFYDTCLKKLDRQIVLIDVLKALKSGQENFLDLNDTIDIITNRYSYGSSNFITRLLSPNIDKVLFVATKADLVVYDDFENLKRLLRSLVLQSLQRIKAQGAQCEFAVIAALAATQCKRIKNTQNQVLSYVREGQESFCYPGTVPANWSLESLRFCQENFKLLDLLPPVLEPGQPLPSINMDMVLNYILEDKL